MNAYHQEHRAWLLAAAIVITTIGSSHAQWDSGSYVKVDAGPSLLQQNTWRDLTDATHQGHDASYGLGMRYDLAAGYVFSPSYRAEISGGAICNSVSSIQGAAMRGLDANLYQFPLLVCLFRQFNLDSALTPYCGIGLGPVFSRLDVDQGPFGSESRMDTVLGFQAVLGLRWLLADNITLGAEYKFLGTSGATYKGNIQMAEDGGLNHSLVAEFAWHF